MIISIHPFLCAQGKEDTLFVNLIAQSSPDSIILRWAPGDYKMWTLGNEKGYKIERFEVLSDAPMKLGKSTALGTVFKPLPLDEWEGITKKNDYAAVAAASVYGEHFGIKDPANTSVQEIYDANSEVQNRFGFGLFACDQSFEVAKAMGLAYVDHAVERNKTYVYTVYPLGNIPGFQLEAGVVRVTAQEAPTLPTPSGLAGDFSDQFVQLSWDIDEEITRSFTSYQIERSDDGGEIFYRRNQLPYVFIQPKGSVATKAYFVDTLEENGKIYHYRVRGKTPFEQFSPPSNVVIGEGLPPAIEARPFIYDIVEFPEGNLKIRWRFDAAFQSKIEGFDIYRAREIDAHYQKLNEEVLLAANREFTDKNPLSANYYIVTALDKNGHKISCVPQLGQLVDAIPPAPPTGLKAVCDTAGNIYLSWNENTESDLLGYRVYFANQKEAEYVQLTSRWVETPEFTHVMDLRRLSEKVYFKVRSLDFRENYSSFSEVLEVKLPDIVPPSPPVFVKTESRKKGVYLNWRNSSSDDVQTHRLQRKLSKGTKWKTLVESDMETPIYEYYDTTASYKYDYHYKILAIDDDGLTSNSEILTLKPIDTGLRPEITHLYYEADRKEKQININWFYPKEEKLREFVIYRAKNDEPMTTYKVIKCEDLQQGTFDRFTLKYGYIDKNVTMNTTYRYALIANFGDGGYSPLTEEFSLTY